MEQQLYRLFFKHIYYLPVELIYYEVKGGRFFYRNEQIGTSKFHIYSKISREFNNEYFDRFHRLYRFPRV